MAIADRLIQKGGVEVIIDDYDLKEGHDIVAYMERLKTDETLNHCLILSDSAYAKKADERKQGVGTEAQIISKEIYESIEQTRFIPIVMEVTDNGKPCLPTFLQNRKYIDFSSPERINQNWDKLIRLLHGKPGRVKPKIGPAPAFLDERNTGLFLQTGIALPRLRNYLMDGKPGVALLRDEVIQNFAEELNSALLLTANEEQKGSEGAQLIARWERRLKVPTEGRDLMVDWILMESKIDAERAVERCVIPLLETIYSMTLGPEGHPEREQISDVMKMLAYEMALYAVACIISVDNAIALRGLFQNPFLSPDPYRSRVATDLNNFFHHSKWAEAWNSSLNPGWLSPVAAKFKEGATHRHIPFHSLIEAEALGHL